MSKLNRRLVLLLPLGIAGVAGIGLYSMLERMRANLSRRLACDHAVSAAPEATPNGKGLPHG